MKKARGPGRKTGCTWKHCPTRAEAQEESEMLQKFIGSKTTEG